MGFLNEAGWDRIVRIVAGILLLVLGWSGVVTGTLGAVLKGIGFIPLLTGLVGWCPIYAAFGVHTKKKE